MSEAAPAAPAPTATLENPGKTLGIVGLILAFFVNIAGLIVSIIALNTSKKAGYKNGLALAGIIVSIASIVIGIIVAIVFISLGAAGFNAIAEMCEGMPPGVYELQTGGEVTCP